MLDAVVIGAGPSDAHFTAQASKKGYSVAFIEKLAAKYSRER